MVFRNNPDFFGGMFDFNGDGQTDSMEEALGYQILEEVSHSNKEYKNDREEGVDVYGQQFRQNQQKNAIQSNFIKKR